MYGGQATHLPLKILTAGVMPIIFAQALVIIPTSLASFFQILDLECFYREILVILLQYHT